LKNSIFLGEYTETKPLTFMQTATAQFSSNCKLHSANSPSFINTLNKCFRKAAQGQLQKVEKKFVNMKNKK